MFNKCQFFSNPNSLGPLFVFIYKNMHVSYEDKHVLNYNKDVSEKIHYKKNRFAEQIND